MRYLAFLQGIFPTQGSNPGLPHCTLILYHLRHQGNPRIQEWVSLFQGNFQPRKATEPGSPALQVDSLCDELPGKPIKTGGLIKKVKIPRKRRSQDFHCLMGREKTRLNGYGCICVNSWISIDTVNLLNIELNIGVKYCVFTLQLYLLPFLPSGNEHPFHPGF